MHSLDSFEEFESLVQLHSRKKHSQDFAITNFSSYMVEIGFSSRKMNIHFEGTLSN